jgi:hypothetical protein
MADIQRFAIFMLAASGLFLAVLAVVTRGRTKKPNSALLVFLTVVVVVFGMVFARYGHVLFQLPWWIYYGLPALLTFLLPPIILKMKRTEVFRYLPMAILMAPVIHVSFSLFVGWHDYMPFPVYIPSLLSLIH